MKETEILLRRDCCQRNKKSTPRAYEIRCDDSQGRHLVASRDISAGEIILEEMPVSVGPYHYSAPVCLGCYKHVDGSNICEKCGFPICSQECPYLDEHKYECEFFQKQNYKFDSLKVSFDSKTPSPVYDAISPLRVLLLRDREPEGFKAFKALQTHLKEWKEDPKLEESHNSVFKILTEDFGWKNLSKEELLEIYGAFYTNDFRVRIDNGVDEDGYQRRFSTVRICYALSSMCSHSCVPTAFRCIADHADGFRHVIRARHDLLAGEPITICYEDSLLPTPIRRDRLLRGKKFLCNCERCLDPTELGSDGGSLLCHECQAPLRQTSPESDYKCVGCTNVEKPFEKVKEMLNRIKEESDEILNDPEKNRVNVFENFIREYSSTLHPNNLLLVRLRYRLCGMYGREPGFTMEELSPVMVERKLRLCEQTLGVLEKIDKGLSVIKGMVLYEMHMPLIMLAQLRLNVSVYSHQTAGKEIRKGLDALKTSLNHLQYEPEGSSFERRLYEGAKPTLPALEAFVNASFPNEEEEG